MTCANPSYLRDNLSLPPPSLPFPFPFLPPSPLALTGRLAHVRTCQQEEAGAKAADSAFGDGSTPPDLPGPKAGNDKAQRQLAHVRAWRDKEMDAFFTGKRTYSLGSQGIL
jgi:hypothetical protein